MQMLKQDKWKTLSSEYLFNRPWLTVRRDSYELPDGRIVPEYYILEYPDWVNTLAITKDGLCAGVSEKSDKNMEAAARRELLEETGFGGGRWREYMVISANPSTTDNLTHCFLAEDVEPIGKVHQDTTEDVRIHLLTLEEVRELLVSGAVKQATHLAPLWKYFAENKIL